MTETQKENKERKTPAQTLAETLKNMMSNTDLPWTKPWIVIDHQNLEGHIYTGMNSLFVSLAAMAKEFKSKRWGTYDQWKRAGFIVSQGTKSVARIATPLKCKVKSKIDEDTDTDSEFVEEEQWFNRWKMYAIFNGDQIKGYDSTNEFNIAKKESLSLDKFDLMVKRYGIPIVSNRGCCYYPKEHKIGIPERSLFPNDSDYYLSLAHELIHSTAKFTGRKEGKQTNVFGSVEYSREEVVAEIGASLLCKEFGLQYTFKPNNIVYIKGWLSSAMENGNLFIQLCSKAEKAVKYLKRFI
jgi:antirestriction protein ArdC